MVAPTELDAGEQQQAMAEFSELIASGKLDLSDLDGNKMNVPVQCVQNCPVEAIGNDYYKTFMIDDQSLLRRRYHSNCHCCGGNGNSPVHPYLYCLCSLYEEEENRRENEAIDSMS